jgi:DNA repair exonuclease SbcCD ATPase subunit
MKLKDLEIENFLTIGEAKLRLDDRGLLLIQGINNDDSSAKSNGAGKSSIVDAISWVNFGITARDVTGDDVVNETVGKNCRVKAVYVDGDDILCVVRFRKHKEGKNSLRLILNGTDISKGTDKETQAEFVRLFGSSAEIFNNAVYAGQERMPDLPAMTDKQLKLLIEEAAGTEILSAAYKIANAKVAAAESEVATLNSAHMKAVADHANLENDAERTKTKIEEWEVERKSRYDAKVVMVKPLVIAARADKERLALLPDPATTNASIAVLRASLASYDAMQKELERLRREASSRANAVTNAEAEARAEVKRHTAATNSLAAAADTIGKPCGECGKPYAEHDLEAVIASRTTAVSAALAAVREANARLKDARTVSHAADKAAVDYAETTPDVSATAAQIHELQEVLKQCSDLSNSIANNTRLATVHANAAKAILEEANPWHAELARLTTLIANAATKVTKTHEAWASASAWLDVVKDAAKVFSPAGVRAHILDNVTPALNEWTKDYLGALGDGNLHATWTTLGKTAKGEIREKFQIEVTNDKGAKSFKGLSGGEKRKVRMACALAMQDLVASRATKPIDLFIADEVDQAMDEAGLERTMGIFERKARERGTVLVISHNSLADWIDQVITVEKTGGVSKVTGAVSEVAEW